MDGVWTFAITAVVVTVAIVSQGGWRKLVDVLAEELNNRRGGPPTTPMHPSPVNDLRLLLRRAPKTKSEHFRY